MPSTPPLNSRPQEAVADHAAKPGIGGVQHAAAGRQGHAHEMVRGYVPVRQLHGTVVGVWGDAHVRHLDGTIAPLQVGDVVKKGEIVLTGQDGIIQIEGSRALLADTGAGIDRLISQVDNGEIDVQPAAGPNSGGAAGSLGEGLRVGRDSESVTPASLDFDPLAVPPQLDDRAAVAPLEAAPVALPDTETTRANTPVVFDPRSNDTSGSPIHVVAVAGQPISLDNPVALPQGTVALNPDGTLTFTPNHNFNGSITFTYTDANTSGGTSTSSVTVAVGNQDNHAPVAGADAFQGLEDTPITGTLTGGDTPSPDGGNVWSLATGAAHGTVSVNADGSFSYVPAAHYSGPDSFTYLITDAEGDTSTATVTLSVAPVPAAHADAFAGDEDTPIAGTLAGNDTASPDGTSVWTLATGAAHGTVVVNPDGTFTYTPAANYHGPDAFTYTITDSAGTSSTASVTLDVKPVNDAPVAVDDHYSTPEDTTLVIDPRGNDSDVDGDPLTVTQVDGHPIDATHPATLPGGVVTLNPDGTLSFTPNPNYNGPADFTYTLEDGHGGSTTATVHVDVTPVNDAPTAVADTYTVVEDTPLILNGASNSLAHALTGNDSDVEGDTLTVTQINGTGIVAGGSVVVANGTVSMDAAGVVTFTPSLNYNGTTTFSYTVADGHGGTATSTASVAVAPVNDAPVANPDSYDTNEDTALVLNGAPNSLSAGLTGNDSDVEGDTLTVTQINGSNIVAGGSVVVANGTVSMDAAGVVTFTPTLNYNGTTTFSYTVADGHGGTATSTASVAVAPVNDAPVANPDSYDTNEDTALVLNGAPNSLSAGLTGNDSDVEGDTLTVTQINGSNIVAGGSVVVANGTVSMDAAGVVTFTPTLNYNGTTTFSYTVADGHGGTATSTASVVVAPVNDAPVANPDSYNTNEDTPLVLNGAPNSLTAALTGNDSDVDGDTLTVTQINGANIVAGGSVAVANGTVSMDAAGVVTFTPTLNYNGTTTFNYTVADGHGGVASSTASIVVAPVNDAPVANPDSYDTNEDTPLVLNGAPNSLAAALTGNDSDAEGDTLTVTQIDGTSISAGGSVAVANGVVSMDAAGVVTFTPSLNYNGTTTFNYTVSDGHGGTATSTASVVVVPVNDAPVANPDSYNTNEDTPLVLNGAPNSLTAALTGNDSDVEGDALTVTQVNGTNIDATHPVTVANGVVSMDASGVVTFTPTLNYNGTATFSYTVSDGHGGTATSTASIVVAPVNDAPTANPDSYDTNEDTPLVLNGAPNSPTAALTGNDGDVDGDTLTVTQINGTNIDATHPVTVAHGVVSMDAAGVVTFTPGLNYNGTTTFNYTVADGHGGTATSIASVVVAPVNDAPVANADSYGTTADTPIVLDGGVGTLNHALTTNDTDADGDTLTVTQIDGHAIAPGASVATTDGTVSMDAAGVVTFTPNSLYAGSTSFTYTVSDGHGGTSTATAVVGVSAVNHAPVANPDGYTTNEDTPLVLNGAPNSLTAALVGNDSDVDGDTLTVTQINGANIVAGGSVVVANGTVSMDAAGVVTFTPTLNYNGTTTFSYTVADGHGGVASSTASIVVAPVNDAPVANPDSYNTNEDTPLVLNGAPNSLTAALTGNDSDVDGDTLTVTQINGTNIDATHPVTVANGVVSMDAAGVVTFTPGLNYNGTTTFDYTVSDGHGGTATSTASIAVAPVNDAPVANPDSYNTNEDTPLVLNGAPNSLTAALAGNDSDVDGDTLTVTQINGANIVAGGSVAVANGTVSMDAAGVVTFTPSSNYNGTTTFDYTVSDGHGGTATSTASIAVAPVNDAPVANPDSYNTNEDTPLVLNGAPNSLTAALSGNDSDVDGDALTVTQINGTNIDATHPVTVANGVVSMDAGGVVTFTPGLNYNGTTTFDYTVSDGHGGTATSTASVVVAPVNDAPVANADSYGTTADTPIVLDGGVGTLNHALTTNDTDADGDTLTVTQIDGHAIAPGASVATTDGTVSMDAAGVVTFTPNALYAGSTSFTYTVSDGHGGTSTATAVVGVSAVNHAPVANPDGYTTNEDTPLVLNGAPNSLTAALVGNDSDVDGDTLTVTQINGSNIVAGGSVVVANGTVSMDAAGVVTFTPTLNYNGTTTFSYTVADGHGGVASSTASIVVAPVNDAPVANPDSYNTNEDTPLVLNGAPNSLTAALTGNDSDVDGDTLTVTQINGTNIDATHPVTVANGVVSMDAAGVVTFTPTLNYNGTTTFDYTVSDGHGGTATSTASVVVAPVNDAPVANPDSYNTNEDTPLVLNGAPNSLTAALTGNDSDVDGDTITVTQINGTNIDATHPVTVANGVVSMDAAGVVTFTPGLNYNGTTTFDYTVSDGHGGTATSTASIVVAPVNDAPVANPDNYNTNEDTPLVLNGAPNSLTAALTGNDSDVDGDTLTVTQINGSNIVAGGSVVVANGTVSMDAAGVVTFTPTLNYNGTTTFDYTVSDGHGGTATSTASIAVAPVNDAPVANPDSYNTNEDTPLVLNGAPNSLTAALTGNDSDVDGDTLTVTQINGTNIVAGGSVVVANGVLNMDAAGIVTFTPSLNYNGTTTFNYTVSDGHGGTATSTASVVVAPVNDAPVANPDNYNTNEDTPLVLNGAPNSLTAALTGNDSDVDGDTLTVTQINGTNIDATHPVTVANGVVSMDAAGIVTFTPGLNYNGTTTFDYTVSDGHGGTATSTASIAVAPVNDAPVANPDSYNTNEDTPLVLNGAPNSLTAALAGNDSDVDGDTLTVTQINGANIVAGGSVAVPNGTVSMDAAGVVTFTPSSNYNGTTTFDYTVSDGHGGTATSTASIVVAPVNDAPVANPDSYNTNEDTPLVLNGAPNSLTAALTGNDSDVDGDTLTVTQINGTNIVAGGSVAVANGTVSMDAAGVVTFTPTLNYNGTTTFDYTVSDGHGGTATSTASIVVAPVNDAPVANPDSYNTNEDTPLVLNGAPNSLTAALTGNDSDVDGDTLTVTQINGTNIVAGGSVVVANGVLNMDAAGIVTFTPSLNYNGTTTFNYTVSDGHGGTATSTASVVVAPINDAPVTNPDSYNTNEDTPLVLNGAPNSLTAALTGNDSDVDGDTLTVTQINGTNIDATHPVTVANGVVSMDAAGVVTFTPGLNYNGTTTFDYTVSDGHGGTATSTASIVVAPVNDAPVANPDSYNTNEDTPLVLNGAPNSLTAALTGNDSDVDGDTITVTQINGTNIDATHPVTVANGVVSMDASGVVTFTPGLNYNGTTTFDYTVSDGHGGTATSTASIVVAPVNDAPVANPDSYNTNEDTPLVLNGAPNSLTAALTGNDSDVDGDTLTVTQINGTNIDATHPVSVANGVVSMDAAGVVTFTPGLNYNGTTTFDYTVSDGHGGTATSTASIVVAPVNDAPLANPDSYNTNEDTALVLNGTPNSLTHALQSNDTDVDGDTLTVTQINGTNILAGGSVAVANGVVSMDAAGVVTFTPTLNYNGTTTFNYTVSDGHGGSASSTASVVVAPVNDAPVANPDSYNTNEDTALVLNGTPNSLTHALTGNDTDVDGDTLTVTQINGSNIVAGGSVAVANGVVSMDAAGVVTFTPTLNYNGTTTFSYTVADGHGGTASSTASVVVAPVNDAPLANPDSYNTNEDTALVLNGTPNSLTHALQSNDTDVDGDTLTVTQINGTNILAGGSVAVANGVVSMDAAGVVTFTPTLNYNGTTTFNYTVSDGHGGTASSTASVVVAPVNDAPVANPDSYNTNEDTALVLNGTPNSLTHGLASNDTDVDGDTLTVTQINGTNILAGGSVAVANGVVSMDAAGIVTFTPTLNYNGTTTFNYTVSDGHGGTASSTASVVVAPVNDAPVANPDSYNTNEDTALVLSGAPNSLTHTLQSNDTDVDGDPLTVTQINGSNIVAGGSVAVANGVVSMDAAGVVTFTPTLNYNGTTTFSYTVADGHGGTASSTASVVVAPVNDAPVANPDSYNTNEDTALVLNGTPNSLTHGLASNDTDVDGDPLTVTQINGTNIVAGGSVAVANGVVSMDAAGVVTFTPTLNYNGTTTFSYTVADGHGGTASSTASVVVAPVNDAPLANPDSYNTNEDTALVLNGAPNSLTHALTGNDTDVDGDPLTVTQINGSNIVAGGSVVVANGTVSMDAAGVVTFTPTLNYNGTTTFNYTVSDGHGGTATSTASVVVAPVNDAPVANPDSYNTNEDTALVLSGAPNSLTHGLASNDTDVDGDTLTVTQINGTNIVAGSSVAVANGVVSMDAAGIVTFTPTLNYNGTTTFNYTVSDGHGGTATSTASVVVAPVNDAPLANPDSYNTNEDTALVLSGAPNSLTHTLQSNDTDVDGDTLTVTQINGTNIVAGGSVAVANGVVSMDAAGVVTFTPSLNYNGTTTFNYTVSDGHGGTASSTASVVVAPVNDAPLANPDSYNTNEDTALVLSGAPNSLTHTLQSNDTDVDGDPLTVTQINGTNIVAGGSVAVANGVVSMDAAGVVTFTPTLNYNGTTTFNYTVSDGHGGTATSTASVVVAPVNDAPVANPDSYNTNEDTALVLSGAPNSLTHTLQSNDTDVDADTLTVTQINGSNIVAGGSVVVANGTVSMDAAGVITFTPTLNYNGTTTFNYTVSDGHGGTATSTASVVVAPVNDAPLANPDSYNTNEDTALVLSGAPNSLTHTLQSNDTDVDGDPLTVTQINGTNIVAGGSVAVANGTVSMSATGVVTFTPTLNYNGTTTFNYTVSDGHGGTATSTASVVVAPVNDAPVANADSYTTNEDTPLVLNGAANSLTHPLTSNDTDVDGDTLTVTQINGAAFDSTHPATITVSGVTAGTLSTTLAGVVTFTPTANWSGNATFNYTVSDGHGGSSTTTASVTVLPVADAPTLTATDKTYYAATDFEETALAGNYGNVLASKLGSGSGTTTAAHAGTWQTTNGGSTVEIGTGGTYGTANTTHVIELEQNPNDTSNLFTTMTTKAGEVYNLSFDYAARGGSLATSVIYVYWEGQLVDTLNTQSATLTHTALQLIATANGTGKLEFVAGDSNSFGGILDNITLGMATNTGVQGYAVNLPSIASTLVDADGSETLKTTIDTLPVGATLTDGTHSFTATAGSTIADVSGWTLGNLAMTSPTAGDFTLGVHATSTEASNGATATSNTTVTVHVLDDTAGIYGTAGNDTLTITDANATATSIRWGLDGDDTLVGSIGHDTLMGGAGNDTLTAGSGATLLDGGLGNDKLVAGIGADVLSGGQGNDTMTAGTGAVSDVFKWHLGDGGAEGSVAGHASVDTIINFDAGKASAGGDILDLRDLLVGELAGSTTQTSALTHFLDFDTTTTAGSTIIHISSHGDFASGYAANNEDQTLILQGVDLRSSMGLAANSTDAQVITELLNRGKLITDGQ